MFLRPIADTLSTIELKLEFTRESKYRFVRFIQEFCILEGITDSEEVVILALSELITAQSTDSRCCDAFVSVQKPNIRFKVHSDEVLLRVTALADAVQLSVPAPYDPISFTSAITSFLVGHTDKSQLYDFMRKEPYCLT